jgi:subtilisin family serine protease
MVTKKQDCLEISKCRRNLLKSTGRVGCTNYRLFPKLGMLSATCTGGMAVNQRELLVNLLPDFTFVDVQSRLLKIPQLRAVSPNEIVKLINPFRNETASMLNAQPANPTAISGGISWYLDRDNQRNPVLDGNTDRCRSGGKGVEVWALDTGCRSTHDELVGRARTVSLVGDSGEDDNGHGTHTAALVVGVTRGLAPLANIVCVKVLDSRGSGTYANMIAAIDKVVEEKYANPDKPIVINMSLGGRRSDLFNAAVDRAWEAVVVAAGNDRNNAENVSPASASNAIAVSAVNYNGCVTAGGRLPLTTMHPSHPYATASAYRWSSLSVHVMRLQVQRLA